MHPTNILNNMKGGLMAGLLLILHLSTQAQQAPEVLEQIEARYQSQVAFKAEQEFRYYLNHETEQVMESQPVTVSIKNGNYYKHLKAGTSAKGEPLPEIETLINDEYLIHVDHSQQVLMVKPVEESDRAQAMALNYSELVDFAEAQQIERLDDQHSQLTLVLKEHPIQTLILTYDHRSYELEGQEIQFASPLSNFIYKSPEKPRIEISHLSKDTSAEIPDALFSEANFLQSTSDGFALIDHLSHYELIDLTQE